MKNNNLSESQAALFSQIKAASDNGNDLVVSCGKYATSIATLKSLVNRGLIITDKKIGFGCSVFRCKAVCK